jgi:hypothetical protein
LFDFDWNKTDVALPKIISQKSQNEKWFSVKKKAHSVKKKAHSLSRKKHKKCEVNSQSNVHSGRSCGFYFGEFLR